MNHATLSTAELIELLAARRVEPDGLVELIATDTMLGELKRRYTALLFSATGPAGGKVAYAGDPATLLGLGVLANEEVLQWMRSRRSSRKSET